MQCFNTAEKIQKLGGYDMSEIEDFFDKIFLGDCISIMKTMPSG